MVDKLFFILTVSFVASDETMCDPFPFGTNIINVVLAVFIGHAAIHARLTVWKNMFNFIIQKGKKIIHY